MQEFDELKNIWQQGNAAQPASKLPDISKASAQTRRKLQNEQRNGAISLLLTSIFIATLAIWGNFNFVHWYTYAAMALVCGICVSQAAMQFYLYKRIGQIDDTTTPQQHLSQWEAYYDFRQQQLKWNNPLYFVLLNLALGLYFVEVLGNASEKFLWVFGVLYGGWMLFAYFVMGKRILAREKKRIQKIVQELRQLESQLSE